MENSSLDAWLEKYDAYYSPDRSISYYNKGQIIGVMLDLAIRDETDNHKSLDDVLRSMNEQFAKRGRFYNESADVRATVEQITGKSFEEFFQRYVSGVDEIPYDDFLSKAGLKLQRSKQNAADFGFAIGRGPGSGWLVSDVTSGGSAEAAGMHRGDQILRINGESASPAQFRALRQREPGDSVSMTLRRDSQDLDVTLKLGSREERVYSITEIPNPTEKQRRILPV